MIFQHSGVQWVDGLLPLLRPWPFWLVLVLFEATLWLLLSMRFGHSCTPVALAVGLTFGVGTQMIGGRGLHGALWALALTAVTIALVLYAQAALHVARVFGLAPVDALMRTGYAFARDVLDGLLTRGDWLFVVSGLALAAVIGHGSTRISRARSSRRDRDADAARRAD